jgi:hypothetical protein
VIDAIDGIETMAKIFVAAAAVGIVYLLYLALR